MEDKRQMLQALNTYPNLGGKHRQRVERSLREEVMQFKAARKKPKGDFVKLLITHKGWNAADMRRIIREPAVCRAHPEPLEAERIWVCERNVPPIGSWILNYTRQTLEQWKREKGAQR